MHFTPTGYIGLPDAVRAIWHALHGDAMYQPIPFSREEERDDQIVRVPTPEAAEDHISDGREQFKESREVLLAALADELLHAEVDEPTGAERYTVPVWYWQSSAAHTTIITGLLEIQSGSLMYWRKFHHCPCFIQRAAFDDWLTNVGSAAGDEQPRSPSGRGRKPKGESRQVEILQAFDILCGTGKVSFRHGGLKQAADLLAPKFQSYEQDTIRKYIQPSYNERLKGAHSKADE